MPDRRTCDPVVASYLIGRASEPTESVEELARKPAGMPTEPAGKPGVWK